MRSKSRREPVTINAGKKGITENLINEVNLLLEKHGVVKVKMLRSLRSGRDKNEVAAELASRVRGKLVDFRGFVLTFEKAER